MAPGGSLQPTAAGRRVGVEMKKWKIGCEARHIDRRGIPRARLKAVLLHRL